MLKFLFNFYNKQHCLLCDRKLSSYRENNIKLCKLCLKKLSPINLNYKLIDSSLKKTTNCTILYKLDRTFKELLYRYKFYKELSLAKSINSLILESINLNNPYDYIVAVPSHPLKNIKTGFLHLNYLCSNLAKLLNIKHLTCLKKSFFPLYEQKNLSRIKRLKSHNNIYCRTLLENKNILLIDDILTSGSTIKKAVSTLYLKKAKNIDVIIFALS